MYYVTAILRMVLTVSISEMVVCAGVALQGQGPGRAAESKVLHGIERMILVWYWPKEVSLAYCKAPNAQEFMLTFQSFN
jgi:hypothetical protein